MADTIKGKLVIDTQVQIDSARKQLSDLQKYLDTLGELLPSEIKRAEVIWKPVYDEYRRLGYRLKKHEQITIFDVIKGGQ